MPEHVITPTINWDAELSEIAKKIGNDYKQWNGPIRLENKNTRLVLTNAETKSEMVVHIPAVFPFNSNGASNCGDTFAEQVACIQAKWLMYLNNKKGQ